MLVLVLVLVLLLGQRAESALRWWTHHAGRAVDFDALCAWFSGDGSR